MCSSDLTVYTFSLILAVFLTGLGLGSTGGAALARRIRRPAVAFGWAQLASVAAMFWAADALANVVPYWPGQATTGADIWSVFRLDAVREQGTGDEGVRVPAWSTSLDVDWRRWFVRGAVDPHVNYRPDRQVRIAGGVRF